MATRQRITSAASPLDAHLLATWFETNGAADPVNFGGTIEFRSRASRRMVEPTPTAFASTNLT